MSLAIDDLLVILVLYEMQLPDSAAFTSLSKGVNGKGFLFIYDNSLQSQACVSAQWNIFYVHDSTNPGVSKAYNEGYRKAKELNKKWMMLADQDTTFPESFFDNLSAAFARNSATELFTPLVKSGIRLISPYKLKLGRGVSADFVEGGTYSLQEFKFINSGLIISTDLFQKSNGYDERFPLDFSDLAFIERVIQHQKTFYALESICVQSLAVDTSNLADALTRFVIYLKASRLFGREYHSYFFLLINQLLRSIKLSVRFRTTKFIRCLIQNPL